MRISLLGYMGAGKSALGKLLAQDLSLPFYDLDEEISRQEGRSVAEVILNQGELFFRQRERKVLTELLPHDSYVLALGGGTPCYYDNMALINHHSVSFYLQRSVSSLLGQLRGQQKERPLIAHLNEEDLQEFIAKHLFERRDYYEEAIFNIKMDGLSLAQAAQSIKKLLA